MTPDDPRHGTYAGYGAGCRCSDCTTANALYEKHRRDDAIRGNPREVPGIGARRRVQALQALGWSAESLSVRLGFSRPWLRVLVAHDRITRRNHDLVAQLFEELCMALPPSTRYTRDLRADARMKGWLPPLAWNNIDDPDERPVTREPRKRSRADVDPVVILRVIAGDRLPMTRAERVAVVRQMTADGWSQKRIEEQTGITKVDRFVEREAS